MSEEQKDIAAEHARRAGRQAKNAAKNGLKAVQNGAEAAAHSAAEELKDEAQKAEGTVEDVVNKAKMADPKKAIALAAVFLGGSYLLGQVLGYRQGKQVTATSPIDVDYSQVD